MTRASKIVTIAVCAVGILLLLIIGSVARQIKQSRDGFSQVRIGQPKETVINLMGKAWEIRSCSFPIYNDNKIGIGECSEILTYRGVFEKWSFAFDKDGKVVEKYHWFLGEYGKRPPDTN